MSVKSRLKRLYKVSLEHMVATTWSLDESNSSMMLSSSPTIHEFNKIKVNYFDRLDKFYNEVKSLRNLKSENRTALENSAVELLEAKEAVETNSSKLIDKSMAAEEAGKKMDILRAKEIAYFEAFSKEFTQVDSV